MGKKKKKGQKSSYRPTFWTEGRRNELSSILKWMGMIVASPLIPLFQTGVLDGGMPLLLGVTLALSLWALAVIIHK